MNLLLDTHSLLWWLDGDASLPPRVRKQLGDDSNRIFVSAASAWEISIKFRLGKLPGAKEVVLNLAQIIRSQGFETLEISVEHGLRAGALSEHHKDPFDRMLIAQSLTEDLALVSNEKIFDAYGVNRMW